MRTLWLLAFVLVAGCAAPHEPIPADAVPVVQDGNCDAAAREEAEPDGQPFGVFEHTLRNGRGAPVDYRIEHRHDSGCILGIQEGTLEAGQTTPILYEEHFWRAARHIEAGGATHDVAWVDWACTWDGIIEADAIEQDLSEGMMCA